MKRPVLLPALLALVLTSCPGCASRPCAPTEITLKPGRVVPAAASILQIDGVAAVTIGSRVYVHPDETDRPWLIEHEREHARQWCELGPVAFPIAYTLATVVSLLPHVGNPFEDAADSAAAAAVHGNDE